MGQDQSQVQPAPHTLDSLYQYYRYSKSDSLSIPERLDYVSSFLDGITPSQHDSLMYIGLMRKTKLLGEAKMYDSAIFYSHQLYDLAEQNKDTTYMVKAFTKLGIYHKNNNQLSDAFQYYNEAFKNSRVTNDSIRAGKSLLQMANIQTFLGDYSGSKATAINGLKYIENTSDLRSLSGLYHIISVANCQQKKYKEALKYNAQALGLNKDSITKSAIGINNILIFKNTKANILADQKKYKAALSIFSALVFDSILQNDKKEYARVLGNFGYVQWLQNKNNTNSQKLLIDALIINKEINDVEGLIESNIYLTKYYFDNDKSKALLYAEAAYQNAAIRQNSVAIIEALGFIFKLKENVTYEARVYDSIHHRLQEINQSNREIYAVTKYENEKLTARNEVLQAQQETSTTVVFVVLGVLTLSLGGLIYYYGNQKRYKRRFLALIDTTDHKAKASAASETSTPSHVISDSTLQHLLTQLEHFEEQHEYLAPHLTVHDLAKRFGSNSSYLSVVVNTYKEKSISQYINDLRIDYAVEKLQSDAVFRKYTIKAIAKEVGFSSSESFSKKFYKKTGIYPSYFVKNLEG